jgi:hypothetical protein
MYHFERDVDRTLVLISTFNCIVESTTEELDAASKKKVSLLCEVYEICVMLGF